ncbi:uncharacterized protein LOC134092158 [Sardina pilchardus]|uniref:uncharacterized protein LOC134092158 n=1 Tax=Sardina pilchardus TaxID=27697 RepID=UPI002E153403
MYPFTSHHSDRIRMFNKDSPGNLSLFISDLTKEDEGDYRCEGSTSSYRDIYLKVKGCSLMEKNTRYEIVKSSGESALLPCTCSPLHAKPEIVTWDVIRRRGSQNGSSISVSSTSGPYKGRVQMFNQHSPGNASLLISDLTEEDQGLYKCYLNEEVKRINLLIKDLHPILPTSTSTPKAPKTQTTVTVDKDIVKNGGSETPLYVFILVAVLLLLLPLGGVIFLYKRHKGQKGGSTQSGGMQERNNDSSLTYEALQHRYNAEQMYSTIGQNAGVQDEASSTYEALQHRYNAEQMYSTIGQNAGVQNEASSTYEALQHHHNAEQMYSTIGQNAGVQATAADYENPSSD